MCSRNVGPDEPFGGGEPDDGLRHGRPGHHRPGHAVPRRARGRRGPDTTPPQFLQLPAIAPLPAETVTRQLALIEEMSDFFDETPPVEALLEHARRRRRTALPACGRSGCGWIRSPRTRRSARPRCGRSTTPPPTPTPCTSTRSSSRWSTARTSSSTRRARTVQVASGLDPTPPGAVGDRLQGHGHRLSRPGHPHQGPVQHARPVRLALPHRRARGQRDDAALSRRTGAARPARMNAGQSPEASAATSWSSCPRQESNLEPSD